VVSLLEECIPPASSSDRVYSHKISFFLPTHSAIIRKLLNSATMRRRFTSVTMHKLFLTSATMRTRVITSAKMGRRFLTSEPICRRLLTSAIMRKCFLTSACLCEANCAQNYAMDLTEFRSKPNSLNIDNFAGMFSGAHKLKQNPAY
jgi:hypothetical protein